MRRGLDWYRREPRAFVDGVRASKLSAREIAVYTITLDLIYEGGGSTPNDPKYIAGYFSDLGTAAVRNAISSLIQHGKLIENGEFLTQKRAENEAKTREELGKTRAVSGHLGGVSPKNLDQEASDHAGSGEANASLRAREDKRREDKEVSKAIAFESTQGVDRPPDGRAEFQQFCQLAERIGLPVPQALTEVRRKHLRARLRQHPDGWPNVMAQVEANPFYRGANDRGWRLDLDWLLKSANFVKVLEGAHIRGAALARSPPKTRQQTQQDDIFRKMLAEAKESEHEENTSS